MRKISKILEELQRNLPIDTVQGIISKKIPMDALKLNTGMKDKEADMVFRMCNTDNIFECNAADTKKYLDEDTLKNYDEQIKKVIKFKFEDSSVIDRLRDSQENPQEPDMSYLMDGDDAPMNDETRTFEWSLLKGICKMLQKDPADLQCILWFSKNDSGGDTVNKCLVAFKNQEYDYDELLKRVIV